jgi:glycosyltransferase involved in cell wall biosynthesis
MIASMLPEGANAERVDLSVVLACYNEEPWLERSVAETVRVLETMGVIWEVVFVDDSSRDGTPGAIRRIIAAHPGHRMKALFHEANTGRGRAVSDGMKGASGDVVGFIDVDLEVHPRHIPACYAAVRKGAQVVVGARTFKFVPGGLPRRVLSWGYSKLVHALLPVDRVTDTESGCKFFLREAVLPVLAVVKDPGWFWDTEMMARCLLGGLSVAEVPCVYERNPAKRSTVRVARDAVVQLRRVFALRRALDRESLKSGRQATREHG